MLYPRENKDYTKEWYYRQKNEGIIYQIVFPETGDSYIGATTNSLKKRLYQHRAHKTAATKQLIKAGYDYEIKELEKLKSRINIRKKEQEWIDKLQPTLNKQGAVKKLKRTKGCYKGGITFNGEWFPTKWDLWEKYGKIPYGTFKSRGNRFPDADLEFLLGISKKKKKSL